MAKLIRATPVLRGDDADKFIKGWAKELKHPSKERVAFIKNAEKNRSFYESQLWKK
ncbi:MAG: hypothetical protein PHR26_01585 [Candidatus ainarchaeum sp.]|nr:hypothetical protein [Candidatus ainarchaeum sp.]MDD3975713.1 hypothetical protein [Candidatus ainarchaeum sp.]